MDAENLINFLKKGSEIAGGAIGGAIGLIGGPVGAIAGGGLGVLSAQLMNEVITRTLSERQQVRIAATSTYIFEGIGKRLDLGHTIRADNFFNKHTYDKSSAEELFEGTLLKCAEQYQERKIKFISHIFEETIFNHNISSETANQFLILSQNLSYRKFCIISYYGRKDHQFKDQIIMKDPYIYYPGIKFTTNEMLLLQDVYELINMDILNKANYMFTSNKDIIPNILSLSEIGLSYYKSMNLEEIPVDDIQPIINGLKYKEEWGRSTTGTINGERPIM